MQTNKTFSLTEAFKYGWDTFKQKPFFWIAFGIVASIFEGSSYRHHSSSRGVDTSWQHTATTNLQHTFSAADGIIILVIALIGILIFIAAIYLSTAIKLGLNKTILDAIYNRALKFSTIFSEFDPGRVWLGFRLSLAYGLLVVVGIILLIIPGIYWSIKYQFIFFFMLDKKTDYAKSMEMSAKMTEGVMMQMFLFNLISIICIVLSAFTIIGVFVVFPIVMIAEGYVYKKLLPFVDASGMGMPVAPESTMAVPTMPTGQAFQTESLKA